MPRRIPEGLKEEVRRLRIEEDLPAALIRDQTGVNIFTIYRILKEFPRQGPPRPARGSRWTTEEVAAIHFYYPDRPREVVQSKIPNHSWDAIVARASTEGVARIPPGVWDKSRYRPLEVMARLRAIRSGRKLTRAALSSITGYHVNQLLNWELGKTIPSITCVQDVAQALGYRLELVLEENSHGPESVR